MIASEPQGIVIDTVIVFLMIYMVLNVVQCLILTFNISVSYVTFLILNKIVIIKKYTLYSIGHIVYSM